jgi:hypothetical protein
MGVWLARGVEAPYPLPELAAGVELATGALLDGITEEETTTSQLPTEIPNWVEYWYWPVTSSMIWIP